MYVDLPTPEGPHKWSTSVLGGLYFICSLAQATSCYVIWYIARILCYCYLNPPVGQNDN